MSINLQIDLGLLDSLVVNQTQALLKTKCLPVLDGTFVDAVDVRSSTYDIQSNSVTYAVTTQVMIVTQAALDASIGFSGGPDADVFTFVINLSLAAGLSSTGDLELALTCTSITVPSSDFQPLANGLVSQLGDNGKLGSFPLAILLNLFAVPSLLPDQITFQVVASSTLLIWFGATSEPPVNHLGAFGLQWCLYVESAAMETLVKNLILGGLRPQLNSNGISLGEVAVEWAPKGIGAPTIPTPFLTTTIVGHGSYVIIPYDVDANFQLGLYLEGTSSLTMEVFWFLNASVQDVFDPILAPIAQTIADNKVDSITKNFDPASIGGTRVDDHDFQIVKSLPTLSFATANLSWNNCIGFTDGMVLGGYIDPGDPPSAGYTEFYTTQFPTQYSSLVSCLDATVILSTTIIASSSSGSDFSIGILCAVDVMSPSLPGVDLSNYVFTDETIGQPTFGVNITVDLPGDVAFGLAANGKPLVVRVRTGRGVRMIDFGVPPAPQFDSSGMLTNTEITQSTDCHAGDLRLWRTPYSIQARRWRQNPPKGWVDKIDHVAAFESALISVPSEEGGAVLFSQPQDGGTTVIHGGKGGSLVVPTLVAIRSYDEGALLETSSRSNLIRVTTMSKMFRRVAVLRKKGALSHRLVGNARAARIVTYYKHGVEEAEVDLRGVVSTISKPLHDSATDGSDAEVKKVLPAIPGCVALHSVPGFEDEGTSIAELDDGSFRVVSHNAGGTYQVTGTVPRWNKTLSVSGNWAISNTVGKYVTVFSVHQTSPKTHTCKCK